MNLAKALKVTVNVPVEFMGETVNISLRPYHSLLPADAEALAEAAAKSEVDALRRLIPVAVAGWDLDWDGEPFPPTYENTERCPAVFLVAIGEAIQGVWQGNAQSASSSQGTSEPAAK